MLSEPQNLLSFLGLMVMWAVGFFALMCFGFVTAVVLLLTAMFLAAAPLTLDVSAWYAGYGYAALAVFAAIVLHAFRTSFGGRPLFTPSHLDD